MRNYDSNYPVQWPFYEALRTTGSVVQEIRKYDFRVSCSQQTIPVRLLLTINPPEHWLKEDFSNITITTHREGTIPVASLFGEKELKVGDPQVRVFYRRSAGDNADNMVPEYSDESLPFLLLLDSQSAICRDHNVPHGTPPTQSEFNRATTVRLAFRVSQNELDEI